MEISEEEAPMTAMMGGEQVEVLAPVFGSCVK